MPKRYDGQIAVVTGASSGIGRRLALDLAARGATVTGLARRQGLLAEVEEQLRAKTPESSTQVCDVGDSESYQRILLEVEERFGRIDAVINNAAIEDLTPVADGLSSAFREIVEVDFFGVVAGTLAVLPGMVERRSGIVVNVSSDSARAPEPGHGGVRVSQGRRRRLYRGGGPRGRRSRRPRPCALPRLGPDGDGHVGSRGWRITSPQVGAAK